MMKLIVLRFVGIPTAPLLHRDAMHFFIFDIKSIFTNPADAFQFFINIGKIQSFFYAFSNTRNSFEICYQII